MQVPKSVRKARSSPENERENELIIRKTKLSQEIDCEAKSRSAEFGYFYNIVEFDATGIDKVATSTNAKEVSRYSANGQRLSAPAKGLNIVKYSDGSVKKVVVQ